MKFCGIDWANDHHDAVSIDEQGRQLGSIRVAHNPEGLSQLDSYLERIVEPGGKDGVACIVETTHGLLIAHLRSARMGGVSGESPHRRATTSPLGSQDGYY